MIFVLLATLVILHSDLGHDDPCEGLNDDGARLAEILGSWSTLSGKHSRTGRFMLTPRHQDGIVFWWEISYEVGGKRTAWTAMAQLPPMEGSREITVGPQNRITIREAYGAGGGVRCGIIVQATTTGFSAAPERRRGLGFSR